MEVANFNSIRSDIMEMISSRFKSLALWDKLETEVALKCADLPDPIDKKSTADFIKRLRIIKTLFIESGIDTKELIFLDSEIELHEKSKMISLYEEKDDTISPELISAYSRLGRNSEGIVAIPQPLNYKQLSHLTNGVYEKTGLVKFYISPEKKIYGKIVAEIYEHAQEIPIATVVESKKIDKETGEPAFKKIILFGGYVTQNGFTIIKEINLPFYVYRFISESNQELILMTLNQCEIGDYVVTGVETQCADYKMLTDSARLPTKLPFFFAQSITNRIIQYKNNDEFKIKLKELEITKENMFNYPFSIKKNNRTLELLQPTWYKWLIWAWLTHEPKGIFNKYPMHILQLGPKMSGKSLMLNALHPKSKESRNIFSGSQSTLKSLVPSFKYNPARLGYLAESNRFAFCDEFLRCLANTRTTKDGSQREESVAMMNDLLEHQKREAGSGISRVNVNMTARILATTNPIKGIHNVDDLINSFDESFLSRWLIYYQTEEHVKIIRNSRDSKLKQYLFKLDTNDWIGFLDYLHTFSADYSLEKVEAIHKEIPKILSENLNKHYDARHMHHIECLMDGLVKARCFLEGDMSFKAKDEDYKRLKEIWMQLIKSWMNAQQIKNISISDRIFYLPENCQYIYWKVCELKREVTRSQIETIALKEMSKLDYYEAWNILIEMRLMTEFDGLSRPHYLSPVKDVDQKRI